MKLKVFERGFNYSQDGPGNRLVYHLQGCNMFCPWCSNPEGIDIKRDAKEYTLQEIEEEIISCQAMFFDGGGVTFTGGECTLQSVFLKELIKLLRKRGISVAIETNASNNKVVEIANEVDYIMIDYKSPLDKKLKEITGGKLKIIEKNIKTVLNNNYVHFRIPFIHGFNDDEESLNGFVKFFSSVAGKKFDVEILPYHEYGKEKWLKNGMKYTVESGFVSDESLKKFNKLLSNANIKIINT